MKTSPVSFVLAVALALGGTAAATSPAAASMPPVPAVAPGVTAGDFEFRSDRTDPAATATLVNYIGSAADVVIPDTVTIDGVDHTVTTIGEYAFSERGLRSVELPDTIVTVEEGAFMWNQLTSITVPDSVVTIAADAFSQSPLTHVTIGASVQSLGQFAFEHYDYDTDTVLPLEVVFTGPPPAEVVAAGSAAFGSFAEADDVTISFPNQYDASVHEGGYTRPLWYGYATQGTVSVAFDLGRAGGSMSQIRAVVGDALVAPEPPARDGFEFAGWYVDEALQSPFDSSAPVEDDLVLYADWDLLELLEFEAVGDVIYMVDVHAENATASAVGTSNSFTGTELAIEPQVQIAGKTYTVTNIGPHSFDGLGLTGVSIPNSIVTIEEYAFAAGDVDLDTQQLTDRNPLGDLVLPDSVQTIEDYAFGGAILTSLRLGSGVQHIGEGAFIDTGITELTLPDGLRAIGEFAFDMNGLTTLVIPDSVTQIDFMAFAGSPLSTVRIGSGVESIGDLAFSPDSMMAGRAAAPRSLVVTFTGAPPAAFTEAGHAGSFGYADGVLVQYPLEFDARRSTDGGFTTPTWQGYASVALVNVTFDLRGHGEALAPISVPEDSLLTDLPTPAADGWKFTGWFTDADASDPVDPLVPVTDDLTLYAGWEQVVPVDPAPDKEGDPAHEGSLAVTGGAADGASFAGLAAGLLVLGASALMLSRMRSSRARV